MTTVEGSTLATMRPAEAASLLRCTPQNLRYLVEKRKLRCERTPGGHRRFFEHEVRELSQQGGFVASETAA